MGRWGVIGACLILIMTLGLPTAMAQQGTSQGPWVQDSEKLNQSGLHDYEQLTNALHRIERSSGGRMTVESVGTSNEGRDIWLAKLGTGDRTVLYITQQHGNEVHGTEAAIHALRTLAGSNRPEVRRILDEITLLVIPRVNPDGSERGASHNWRQNYDPDCDAAENACTRGRGFDPNRWHDPRIPDEAVLVPETLAVRQVYAEYQPELVVDYHNQGRYLNDDGEQITMSVVWSTLPVDAEVTPEREAAIDYGRQVSRLMYDSVQDYGHAEVSLYPIGDEPTLQTARNAYGYQGSGSVLVETSGASRSIGQKSAGKLIRQLYVTMLDVAAAVADETVFDIDPASADEIPPRGPGIGNPNAGKPGERCANVRATEEGIVGTDAGRLYDYVIDYEAQIVPSNSDAYVRPTKDEACALQAAYQYLVEGEPALAAGLADDLDYEVVEFADNVTGRTHYILAERPTDDVLDQRGWGMYVHDSGSDSNVTVEVPNPRAIANSQRLGVQAFDAIGAGNLLIHGARNSANRADDLGVSPADPRANGDSVFHHIHLAAVQRGDVAVQTIGTSEGGSNEIVVTAGQVPPTDLAEIIGATFVDHGYDVCLFGDGSCLRLSASGNIQGQASRAVGADWVALYPHATLRNTVAGRQAMSEALAEVFLGPEEPPQETGPAQHVTDFADDVAGESPAGWTGIWRDGAFTIADQPRRLYHQVVSSGRQGLTWDAVGDQGHVQGDVEVAALVRVPSPMTSTRFVLPIHASGTAALENAYYLDVNGNNVRINRYLDGTFSNLASSALPFTFTADTWYNVVLQRTGDEVAGKVWPVDADEPADWQVTVVDDELDGGRVGVGHLTSGADVDWASYAVGTGGEAAPR
jgi:hypothetical protein